MTYRIFGITLMLVHDNSALTDFYDLECYMYDRSRKQARFVSGYHRLTNLDWRKVRTPGFPGVVDYNPFNKNIDLYERCQN